MVGNQPRVALELDEVGLELGVVIRRNGYPFNDQVILRDVTLGRMGGHPPLFFELLKFYPLSFMLTWERDVPTWDFRIQDLASYRRLSNDDSAALIIDLQAVSPQRWPEAPLDDCMLMMAGKPMIAEPRSKRGTR